VKSVAEPALHPLYLAVREYLEIKQRVLILNERCRVFLDLAAILADHIADSNITSQSSMFLLYTSVILDANLFDNRNYVDYHYTYSSFDHGYSWRSHVAI